MRLRLSPLYADMLKVHVQPYTRSAPGGGAQVQVGAYDDSRQKEERTAPSAPRGPGAPQVKAGLPRPPGQANVAQRAGATQPGAFQRPMPMAGKFAQPAPAKNPWKEHGDKLYLLTGKDEYLHSDTGGSSWKRSKVPGVDLHADAGSREKVRKHLESHGFHNPTLSPDLLAHVRDAHMGAKEHPGHFGAGVEEESFRHKQRQAVEKDDVERATARADHPTSPAAADAAEAAVAATAKPWTPPADAGAHAKILKSAEVEAGRPLGTGISAAMLLKLKDDGRGIFKRGGKAEPNVRYGSIPHGTAHKREVAARAMDDLLGLGMVPQTVAREHEGTDGSMQAWEEGAQAGHEVKQLGEWLDPKSPQHNARIADAVGRMGLFDAVIGHADRHSGNVVLTREGDVRAIDNGISQAYGFEGVAPHSVAWKRPIAVPPDVKQKLSDLSLAEVEQAIGKHVEPWAVAHTYARAKYLASKDVVSPHDLTTQKLFEFAKETMPHVYKRMVASWDDWGPEPPRWKEVSEGAEWPPKGKPGHEYAMRETVAQAHSGVRSDRTAPSKPKPAEVRP